MTKVYKPLTPEQLERKRAHEREYRQRRWREDPEYREAHYARQRAVRKKTRIKRTGITPEMREANTRYWAAARYDKKHGTNTRNELPPEVIEAYKAYQRLKCQKYRISAKDHAERDGTGRVFNGRANSLLLPDDGIIDPVAVEITVRGDRVVSLTKPERLIAVALMERMGVSQAAMGRRLGLSEFMVWYLREEAQTVTQDQVAEVAGEFLEVAA